MSRRTIRVTPMIDESQVQQAEEYLVAARELSRARNFLGALESLSHAFNCVKDHPEAILLQASVRAAQGRPELASKDLERFANLYPSWPSSGANLSGWLMRDRRQVMGMRQKRWYCLKDKFLFYYREPTDPSPLSGYVVETASVGQETLGDSRDQTQFTFSIPPSINYIMDAFDTKSRAEWIAALTAANMVDPFEEGKVYISDVLALTSGAVDDITPREPALMEGYLSKRGDTNTDWKLRWFTLRGTLLVYHDKEGGKSLGSIDIRNCKVRQGEDEDAGFPFQLITPLRKYCLDSEHAETTRTWIMAIFNAQESAAAKMSADGISAPPDVADAPYELSIGSSKKSARPASSHPGSPSGQSSAASDASATGRRETIGWTPVAASDATTSDEKQKERRKTFMPTVGRKLGGVFGSSKKKSESKSALKAGEDDDEPEPLLPEAPRQPYLGQGRNRQSALRPDSETAVELRSLNSPGPNMVALASLNAEEELRRNRAAIQARPYDRSPSEMLTEPLILQGDEDEFGDEDGTFRRRTNQWCFCGVW